MKYYSPTTCGFYDDTLHSSIPEGSVDITDAEYEAVMAAQAQGAEILAGGDGKPVAIYPEEPTLERAREIKHAELLANVNKFIAQKPDGKTRYDTNLKLNLLDWRDEIRDINADPSATAEQLAWAAAAQPLIDSVKAWIAAVQEAYLYDRKAALYGAADAAALEAVDVSYEWFEERYGLTGTVLADPDVYTSDIAGAGQ